MAGTDTATKDWTQTQTVVNPGWTQQANQTMLSAAGALTAPFIQVPQNMTAGLNADQQRAFGLARTNAQDAYTAGPTQIPQFYGYDTAQLGNAATVAGSQLGGAAQSVSGQLGGASQANPDGLGGANQAVAGQLGNASMTNAAQLGNATMANGGQLGGASQATAQTMDPNTIPDRMNPYMQSVIDPAVQQARRALRQTHADIGARSAAAGAFGGSRESLERAQANRGYNENVTQLVATLMSQGYDRATAQAQADAQIRQQTNLTNTGANNQFLMQQSNLDQQIGLANAAARNQYGLQQASLDQQSALANQNSQNQYGLQQGQFDQQVNLANAGASNTYGLQQGQLDQQTNLANTAANNQFGLQQGSFDQQAALANQNVQNQFGLQNAAYQQQVNMANPGFALQSAQAMDAMTNNDLSRQQSAMQQLLGVGNQQQLFNQQVIDQPWTALDRVGQYVPKVYDQTQITSRNEQETTPNKTPGMGQQLLGTAATILPKIFGL